MKNLIMMTMLTLSVNLAAAQPKNDSKLDSSRESRNDQMNRQTEMDDNGNIDSVTSGQSSTRTRKNMVTPTDSVGQAEKCYDKNGFWVSKSDAAFESCMKENSKKSKK